MKTSAEWENVHEQLVWSQGCTDSPLAWCFHPFRSLDLSCRVSLCSLRGQDKWGMCFYQQVQVHDRRHCLCAQWVICGIHRDIPKTLLDDRRVSSVPNSGMGQDGNRNCPLGPSWCKEVTCPVLLFHHETLWMLPVPKVGHSALYFLGYPISKEGKSLSVTLHHYQLWTK